MQRDTKKFSEVLKMFYSLILRGVGGSLKFVHFVVCELYISKRAYSPTRKMTPPKTNLILVRKPKSQERGTARTGIAEGL